MRRTLRNFNDSRSANNMINRKSWARLGGTFPARLDSLDRETSTEHGEDEYDIDDERERGKLGGNDDEHRHREGDDDLTALMGIAGKHVHHPCTHASTRVGSFTRMDGSIQRAYRNAIFSPCEMMINDVTRNNTARTEAVLSFALLLCFPFFFSPIFKRRGESTHHARAASHLVTRRDARC